MMHVANFKCGERCSTVAASVGEKQLLAQNDAKQSRYQPWSYAWLKV